MEQELLQEIASYWGTRAEGYSEVNEKELAGSQREAWLHVLEEQFPEKKKEEMKILDIGTGPGFFPMILSEAGYTVAAVDYTEEMLEKAKENLGKYTKYGLERVTKVMMIALLAIMVVLAINSFFMTGAKEGLKFYLVPDFGRMQEVGVVSTLVGAMNQAFFTLSLGIGAMAIFGSYIGKERSLLGESVNIIVLDTFVAVVAGMIMFPACDTYNLEVTAGPSLLFDTMASVFNHMQGGRWWGALFFLFMVFAAMSTVFGVCENLLAMIRELTGWSRPVGCIVCGIGTFLVALPTALGYSLIRFQPFAKGTAWLDLWDFIVSNNAMPLGSLILALFCCTRRGWGWNNFLQEANAGKGLKIKAWMKPLFCYFVPVGILFIYIYGMFTFPWH